MAANLHQLLKAMVDKGSSDLHITTGSPPQLRIDGQLIPLRLPPLTPTETKQLCYSILTDAQKVKFEEDLELDLSFGVKSLARFRANVFMQRGAVAGAFRLVPLKVPTFGDLGLPPVVRDLCRKTRGLVLVTGPTGAGKSTTLAAMIDTINTERRQHIVTIEDPIEFLHPHKGCVVNQREVGTDTKSFKGALKHILRQDPDIVLIGEMRDLETIEAALQVAETGHMAFATLHTNGCVETINRIVDVFPPYQQTQVRTQLSFVIEGIISQQLLPKATGQGRVMACEVLMPSDAIRALVRENKVQQLYSQMQVGQAKNQMQTMNQALHGLYARRLVTLEDVIAHSPNPDELRAMIQTGQPTGGTTRPAAQ
ncbi:MAG: type IV pilus twitching motility protein PilT [Myxococcota bacterium]